MLTANAGLALFGEFAQGLGLHRWLEQEMPLLGSRRGYEAVTYVETLVLMLAGGGRPPEDMRMLKNDTALTALLKLDALPSTDSRLTKKQKTRRFPKLPFPIILT